MVEIRHIDDVLPAIEGRKDFVVIERDGYTAVDYVYADRDSFDCPTRLECRGIKFGPDGRILARPFQKFFNLGERQQAHEVDFGQPHQVFEKLDGSMIHPAIVGGGIRLMTRKGVTDVAEQAERFLQLNPEYFPFMDGCLRDGQTPIFEYTAPDNRIVLRYGEPKLTLLAIRETVTGKYVSPMLARSWAERAGIPHVLDVGRVGDDVRGFVDRIRALQGAEGVVVCFHDGHRIKLKADEYVRKHKAVDGLQSKKGALAIVLANCTDDVLPILDAEDAAEFREFDYQVWYQVNQMAARARRVVDLHGHKERKEFATRHAVTLPREERSLAFAILDGKAGDLLAADLLRRNPDLVQAKWRGE